MPQILVDGQLQEVSQAEFDAWTAANPGPGEAPAGGDVLQVTAQPQILVPNTTNTSPDQELNDLYEEFAVTPSTGTDADYYGEELTKDVENRKYFFPKTLEPVSTDADYLAQLAQQELDREPIVAALSQPVTSGLYTAEPLIKGSDLIAKDSAASVGTSDPQANSAVQFGRSLTTEPVRNSAPKTGDTLSGGGAAALIGAAALGAYAFKALSPGGIKDYYAAADEADRLAIDVNARAPAPISQGNFNEYGYPNIGDVPPENYDAISLDNPYQDGPDGAEDLATGEVNYGDELSLDNPYQDTGDEVIDLDTGEALTTGLDDIYTDSPDGAVDLATGEVNYGDELSLDSPYQDETGGAVDLATGDVNFGQDLDLNTPYEDQANFTEFTENGPVEWTPEDAAGIDSPYDDQTGGLTEFTPDGEVQWTEEDATGLDTPYQDQGDGALDLDTGEINYGDDLSLDNPYQDQGDGALDLDTGEINYGDELSLDQPYQGQEGAQDLETGEFFTDSDAASRAAAEQQAAKLNTQAQAELQRQRNQATQGDWRVRLRLAPNANYLYKASGNLGILQPLQETDGVVFPYLPQIQTAYTANYTNYDLTHSNYRGYFYQSSHVGEINIIAPFTAQDTSEANYLLAVIHFFRTATKMFYGQDTAGRGSPPPLVYLQGLGTYQFNLHPCVISQFSYNLPNDVDYIRARSDNYNGTNLIARRDRQSTATNPFASAIDRLKNAGLPKGGIYIPPAPPTLGQALPGKEGPTYVPTKMEIQLTLLPIQSREQVSKQFSLQGFANGNLLKGGFW